MRDWPTDPVRQHNRLIAALCEDMASGIFSLDGPNVSRVAEINRQFNSTRDSWTAQKAREADNGE